VLYQDALVGTRRIDLRLHGPRVGEIAPANTLPAAPGERVTRGGMLTPTFAEPHVHLDAALLGARAPNKSGTLREGIANWAALRSSLTRYDVKARARLVLEWYRLHGTTRVRTHVDTGCPVAVEALLELREEVRGETELQVVAFPQEGILRSPGYRQRWEAAVRMGCDAVGAIPHFERTAEEGWVSIRMAFDLAEAEGKKLDFHCDETDDPGSRNLEVVCAQAIDRGWSRLGDIVAGHCTALHSYADPHAAKVCELVARAQVLVVTNPLDNVVLQGRYDGYPKRRGITRVDQLWAAGAEVGIGHDSVVDPWYRLGTANLLDAAYMLVHVGHLTSETEMRRVFSTLHSVNHAPFGTAPTIEVGQRAPIHWDVDDPIEVLRLRPRPTAPPTPPR
jgi:cytosine deaminase